MVAEEVIKRKNPGAAKEIIDFVSVIIFYTK